jgi:hypothetical protein
VVEYHGLARRYLTALGLLMRPLLNGGTLGGRRVDMGLKKIPSEGGTGGKRGHSNMEHWAYTQEIKDAARTRRRIGDKQVVSEQSRAAAAKTRPR